MECYPLHTVGGDDSLLTRKSDWESLGGCVELALRSGELRISPLTMH